MATNRMMPSGLIVLQRHQINVYTWLSNMSMKQDCSNVLIVTVQLNCFESNVVVVGRWLATSALITQIYGFWFVLICLFYLFPFCLICLMVLLTLLSIVPVVFSNNYRHNHVLQYMFCIFKVSNSQLVNHCFLKVISITGKTLVICRANIDSPGSSEMYCRTFVFQTLQKTINQPSFSSKTRLISYYSLRVIKTNESVSCLHSSLK